MKLNLEKKTINLNNITRKKKANHVNNCLSKLHFTKMLHQIYFKIHQTSIISLNLSGTPEQIKAVKKYITMRLDVEIFRCCVRKRFIPHQI
jgi:hypothetical protein